MGDKKNEEAVGKILNYDNQQERSKKIKDYIDTMKKDETYGSTQELHACSYVFKKPFLLHTYGIEKSKDGKEQQNITSTFMNESDNSTYANVEHVILYMYDPNSKNNHFEGVIFEDKK